MWMLGSQGLFPNRQRALVERLGLGVAALIVVERRQVVEKDGSGRIIRAKLCRAVIQAFSRRIDFRMAVR